MNVTVSESPSSSDVVYVPATDVPATKPPASSIKSLAVTSIVGRSLTGVTLIVAVAGSESNSLSFAVKLKLVSPFQFSSGTKYRVSSSSIAA